MPAEAAAQSQSDKSRRCPARLSASKIELCRPREQDHAVSLDDSQRREEDPWRGRQIGARLAAYGAYTKAISDAGVKIASQRLRPTSTATTVRVQNGKTQVLNGPYAEVKEQLGGFYLIDAPDLDSAISWAARCPGAEDGAIEVRPIWEM
jgi:hypothetical protein